jgi:DNA polymerase III epsilon subunit-like protein
MKPKILLYDIETSPNLSYMWGQYEQNALSTVKERELLSIAYKYLGEKAVKVASRRTHSHEELLQLSHELLQEADIIVAHNGDSFDYKVLKALFIRHGLPTTKRAVSVDTKKAAKAYFAFRANSLNELGKYLGLGQKVETEGFSLWLKCMAGDAKALRRMETYNKQDVRLLEAVFNKLRPWIENHPNVAKLMGKKEEKMRPACPSCGSDHTQSRGRHATAGSVTGRHQCMDCGFWFRKALVKK